MINSQIFGLSLYVLNIDLSQLFSKSVPIILQICFNYLLFKCILLAIYRFEIFPLPIYSNQRHLKLVKSLLLPSAAIILLFSGGGILLAIFQALFISITVNWSPFLFIFIANSLFLLSLESFTRIGKKENLSITYLVIFVFLFLATLLTLASFYAWQ